MKIHYDFGIRRMQMWISTLRNRTRDASVSLNVFHNHLNVACDILNALASGTEGEFICLGEKLRDFYSRAKTLSDLSSQVAGCLSGEALQQGMEGLQTIFAQVQQQDALSGKGISALSSLLNRFDQNASRMESFGQTIRNLDVLCNFIKIESARLGGDTGFNALGDEVRKLAVNVASKSAELTEHSDKLAGMIRQGLQRMKVFEKRQQGSARIILDQTMQSLSAMNLRRRSSSETLSETAARWKRMSQSIGEVVSSMQFHDITRQRIEHVRDALRDVAGKLAPTSDSGRNDGAWRIVDRWRHFQRLQPEEDLAVLTSAMVPCEVQKIQLKDAETDMTAAVERIIRNMSQIGNDIGVMAGDLQSLIAASGNKGEASFLSELENRLTSLGNAISAYRTINREWTDSVAAITASVGNMDAFIRDIEKIGIQMRMIALNACIHAAHIGQEGAALGTLAEAIRQLSDETSCKIHEISEGLKAIVADAGAFSADAGSDNIGAASSAPTIRTGRSAQAGAATTGQVQIETLIAPLHQVDQKVSGLLTRIGQDGGSLMQDIETTVQNIDIHQRIRTKIQDVMATLASVADEIRSVCPAAVSGSVSGASTEMAERYTMEREREIHQSIAGTAAAASVAGFAGTEMGAEPASSDNSNEPEIFTDISSSNEEPVDGIDDVLFEDVVTSSPSASEPAAETPDTAAPEDDLGDNVELF